MRCSGQAAPWAGDAARSSCRRPGTALKDLNQGTIAIPGRLTTAFLLLRLYDPSLSEHRGHDL